MTLNMMAKSRHGSCCNLMELLSEADPFSLEGLDGGSCHQDLIANFKDEQVYHKFTGERLAVHMKVFRR